MIDVVFLARNHLVIPVIPPLYLFSSSAKSLKQIRAPFIFHYQWGEIFEDGSQTLWLPQGEQWVVWSCGVLWHIFMTFWPSFWVFPPKDLLLDVAKKIVRLLVQYVQSGNYLLIGQSVHKIWEYLLYFSSSDCLFKFKILNFIIKWWIIFSRILGIA